MTVDNLRYVSRQQQGWQFDVPARIAIDDRAATGFAEFCTGFRRRKLAGKPRSERWSYVRASNLELSRLEGLLPIAEKISPQLYNIWGTMQPSGLLEQLALDIPLQSPGKTRFRCALERYRTGNSGSYCHGVEHVGGTLEGSMGDGRLTVNMAQAKMPYETVFRAPLEIEKGEATLNWQQNEHGFLLDGRNIDVQANAIHAHGGFRYLQPQDDEPHSSVFWRESTLRMAVRHGVISRKI